MKKILIIEDNQLVATIYRNKFSAEGYEVETALNGETGLDSLRKFRPDALILDLMLPGINGVELLKTIRAEPGSEQLPIIVFTSTYLTNLVQEAWKAGATKCLSKTQCTPKEVVQAVASAIEANLVDAPSLASFSTGIHATAGSDAPPAAETQPTAGGESDTEFSTRVRATFAQGVPATIASLRGSLQNLLKSSIHEVRFNHLQDLRYLIHGFSDQAGLARLGRVAQFSEAFEALLTELCDKPEHITSSTLRTIASAIDLLGRRFAQGELVENHAAATPSILVVDDEPISRRAVTSALDRAGLKSLSLADPLAAYNLAVENKFDLIFLDVNMPGMTGFELCAKVRALPDSKHIPIVFVTGLSDFESRASSTLSGGTDLIAKPFLFTELAVKALICLLRHG